MTNEKSCTDNIGDLYFALNTLDELFSMFTLLSKYMENADKPEPYLMQRYLDAMRTVTMTATDHLEIVLEAMRKDINKTEVTDQ